MRNILKGINKSLESDIFYILNNYNIRHNNIAEDTPKYRNIVANMSDKEIVKIYDVFSLSGTGF